MRNQITHEEVIDTALFGLRAKLYKCMPGIVTKGGTAAVDVQPAVHDVRFDPVLGSRISEPWPIIPGVPVGWPAWGRGKFALVGTLEVGDKVWLQSPDLDPTRHRGTGNAEDPADTSRHTGAYWIATPMDITDAGALASPGDFAVLGDPSGVQVQVGSSAVSLGGANGSDHAALASILDSFISVFIENWTPVAEDGGAALKAAILAWQLAQVPPYTSTAATKVKIAP